MLVYRTLCVAFSLIISTYAMTDIQTEIKYRMEQIQEVSEKNSTAGQKILPELYESYDYNLIWDTTKSTHLTQLISEMSNEGLLPEDYFDSKIRELSSEVSSKSTVKKQVTLDLLKTESLIRMVYHLEFGKVDPEALDANWNIYKEIDSITPVKWFTSISNSDNLYEKVKQLIPDVHFFTVLRKALQEYREIQRNGGWKKVPAGETLELESSSERVVLLKKRLIHTKDYMSSEDSLSELFDSSLHNAVIHFQNRHGLTPDGKVGKGTLRALNVPVEKRIDQILVNLERARWIYNNIENEFIMVNIAAYQSTYIKNDTILWRGRSQVGKNYRQSPVFRATMDHLVFNPTWTVPPTVLKNDVVPAIKKDRSYLTTKNMKILTHQGVEIHPDSIDWEKISPNKFPYMIRQEPGKANALGLVKFMFPNKHYVFMHDTPSKSLFNRESRAFSSGCIRVENPFDLAEQILNNENGWNRKRIDETVKSEKMTTVKLKHQFPVFLLYATAFPLNETETAVAFREDIYERDQKILDQLYSSFKPRQRHLK